MIEKEPSHLADFFRYRLVWPTKDYMDRKTIECRLAEHFEAAGTAYAITRGENNHLSIYVADLDIDGDLVLLRLKHDIQVFELTREADDH